MLSLSFICYGATALLSLTFGIIYLTRRQFMPYHSLALGKPWSSVEANTQTLILALMRVAGGGFLSSGIAIAILLLIPFAAGERWAVYGIFAVSLIMAVASGSATLMVSRDTPGNPPLWLSMAAIVLSLLGFGCSLWQ